MNKANIIITKNCNLRCLHCYIDAKYCFENYDEIFIDAKKTLQKISENGINNIMITGGECMLFPYLKELIIFAKSLNMKVSIFTNGMIFNKVIFDLVDHVNLSIDGNKDAHNYIRQNKNSYDNVINVLEYLKKIDKKTSVQMTINDLNIYQLDNIAELGLKYLNIRSIKLILTSNIGRARLNEIGNKDNNIEIILNKLESLYEKTKYHIQFSSNIISQYDFENYYVNNETPFALWFDIPNNEYYLFSKDFFMDNINNYNYVKIKKKNKEIFNIIKRNMKNIESHKFIDLENILNDIVKVKDNG